MVLMDPAAMIMMKLTIFVINFREDERTKGKQKQKKKIKRK